MSKEVAKVTVDDMLNKIDYKGMRSYTPSAFSIKVVNFIKLVNGGAEENKTPPVHFKMLDGLCNDKVYIANLCFRGMGKTTLFCEYLILYLAVFQHLPKFGHLNTAIFVGDTVDNGVKSLRKNLESRYQRSTFLKEVIPSVNFTDKYIEFTNAKGQKFGLALFGATSGVRGIKIFGKRPELAILDDLVSSSDAESKTILDSIKTTIYSDLTPILHPTHKKIIFNGTPFNKNDPIYEAIESGVWHANVYPVCEHFPCDRADFAGAWGDRFTYDSVLETYNLMVNTGKVKFFRQEYMLRITSEEDKFVTKDLIRWFKTRDILKEANKYNFVITTDFATTTSARSDYTAIGVWALDHLGNRYLVDGVIGRFLMSANFQHLFRLVKKYNPMLVGIETSGQQGAFISLLQQEMIHRQLWFTIAKGKDSSKLGIPSTLNKMERFKLTEPAWRSNKFYLPEDLKHTQLVQEIEEELNLVTKDGIKSKHDDALDMISQLEQIWLPIPSTEGSFAKSIEQEEHHDMEWIKDPFNSKIKRVAKPTSYDDYLA